MERVSQEHLSPEKLALLYEEARQGKKFDFSDNAARSHLESCPACQERYRENEAIDPQFENLRTGEKAPPRRDCPDASVWYEIAGGVTPAEEALQLVQHASRCEACGPLLREAVADLNREPSEAERRETAGLMSANREWQRKLARRIAGVSESESRSGFAGWWTRWATAPRLAMAGVAAAAIVAVAWRGAVPHDRLTSTNQLLARAYSDQRTLELRFAGAAYAPLQVPRGPAQSFVERSANLLKAESVIASQLPSHPSDPKWLQAKAQADLLEGKYDAAVESLKRALELEPHSAGVLTDLATAYYQRGRQEDRPEDYGAAYEHLSQVLARDPDDAVALYNRAIVAEQQFLYHQALEDWEHFLKVDARSEWADEARSRADALRAKLKEHENKSELLKPAEIAARTSDAALEAEVDARVEEYLQEAVRTWLPNAYPETRAAADPQTAQALFFLADLTARQHHDRWLADLLQGSSEPSFAQAIAALARSYNANDSGEYDTASEQGRIAESSFRNLGNSAGAVRSRFEQVFAAQLLRRTGCRNQAASALAEAEAHDYPWLQIQLGLEMGVCSGLMGDLGADEKAAGRARDRALAAGYGALYVRALGFVAEDKFETGDATNAWRLVISGLARFWTGPMSLMRGYSLYSHLAYSNESAGQPQLQVAICREAAVLVDRDKDLLLRAIAHKNLADAATAAQLPQLAAQQYERAARLYAQAPQSDASRSDALENQIRTAQLEAQQQQFDSAIARLTGIQSEVRQLNNYLALMFYSTLGELQLRQHHTAEAEQALRPALLLAERSLSSLTSEAERMNWSRDAAPVYLAMTEAQLVQGRVQESLELFEWFLGASRRAGRDAGGARGPTHRFTAAPDPAWLGTRIPLLSGKTVLAYGVLPDGLAIWTCDDRGVYAQWMANPPGDLPELTARFYDLTSDPRSGLVALRRDARSLYNALIAPVEARLEPGRTVVIEAEGWPARVPFEALLDSGDHYLVERGPIVYSLGQYSDALMHNEVTLDPDLPALIVGSSASSQAADLRPIPGIGAEADAVAARFHHARLLKGRDATVGMVERELTGAAVFHFAGHALATPDRAGLLLESEDAHAKTPTLLDAHMLRQPQLNTMQLAVLSACSTGQEGSRGLNSMTEALLRGGVPHVVASRWAVDSEARRFVEDMYGGVLSGQPVARAVQQASRRMLSDSRTAHPYYWSAFAAYGRP